MVSCNKWLFGLCGSPVGEVAALLDAAPGVAGTGLTSASTRAGALRLGSQCPSTPSTLYYHSSFADYHLELLADLRLNGGSFPPSSVPLPLRLYVWCRRGVGRLGPRQRPVASCPL